MDKSTSSLCSGYSVWRGKLGLELSRARLAAAQRDLARGDTRVTRWVDSRASNQVFTIMKKAYFCLLLVLSGCCRFHI